MNLRSLLHESIWGFVEDILARMVANGHRLN